MTAFAWPEAVVILSTRDDVVAGTSPQFQAQWGDPHWVCWFEGGHERRFLVAEVLEEDADHFKFRDTRGETFELLPMSLELYEKHVRKRTVGQKHFATLPELLAAMRAEW